MMKFKKVTLHAFRAYENKENGTFDFTLPKDKIANFISIYAPNGFGKTSFYDGVEWCLTDGSIRRFKSHDEDAEAERVNILDNEKQFILQNKKIDIRKNRGYVEIETDRQNYEKRIMQISTSPTADYVFNKRKIKNSFFQDIILSQEGINSFLNEDNDKDRYKKYSLTFGNNKDLDYHRKIVLLERKHSSNLKQIKKRIEEIKILLDSELDENIFDNVNKILHQLKFTDEEFKLVNDSFDANKKLKLDNKISEKIIDLNRNTDYYKSLIDKLPILLKDSEKYFMEQSELKILKVKLNDYIRLNDIHIKITFLKNKLIENRKEIIYLEELKQDYPIYKKSLEILKDNKKNIKKDEERKLLKEKELLKIEIISNQIQTNIQIIESKKDKINKSLKSISEIFKDITNLQNNIRKNTKKLENDKIILLRYENEIKDLEKKQKEFQEVKNAIINDVFVDIDISEEYKRVLKRIEALTKDNEINSNLLQVIKNKRIEYQKYNKNLQKLLSLGINIINEKQDNICPLCRNKHDSYNILKKNIINNPFMSAIEQDLLDEEEKINFNFDENNKKIEDEKQFMILNLNEKLLEITNKLKEFKYKSEQINLNQQEIKLEEEKSRYFEMLKKTKDKPEKEYRELKDIEFTRLFNSLNILYNELKEKKSLRQAIYDDILILNSSLEFYSKMINDAKSKKEYKTLDSWINTFNNIEFNVLDKLNNNIEFLNNDIAFRKKEIANLDDEFDKLKTKYNLIDIEDILNNIEELRDKEFSLIVDMKIFKDFYRQYFTNEISDSESVKQDIINKKEKLSKNINEFKNKLDSLENLKQNTDNLLKFIENKKRIKEYEKYKNNLLKKIAVQEYLKDERENVELKINKDVESFFHEDLINKLYSKIDPHPDYKRVKFKCSFDSGVGKLNVFVNDEKGDKHISPALYYSTAQLNILSLSIFLAKALNVKDDKGNSVDCIFIDDPVQSMDSINILSTIDLLRSLVVNHNKQIILSTHDENFHRLLEKKIPTEYFDSKFIEFETFGKVKKH